MTMCVAGILALVLALSASAWGASGVPQWTANGVALRSDVADDAQNPQITSDGSGGAIVTWQDGRQGSDFTDIYAQRVNSTGAPQWTANGVPLRSITGTYAENPTIASDGVGGAIVTWKDSRSGDWNIYAQRVNSLGAPQWTANGIPLRIITGYGVGFPTITSDGSGGAIVTWCDFRSGTTSDIYAQRVNSSGAPQWTANGVPLRSITGSDTYWPAITSDGSGGAIVTWGDYRSGTGIDLYAQRVNSLGAPQWTANGVALRSGVGKNAQDPTVISDGSGGAIVTWYDNRSLHWDIYAQRVNLTGVPQWTANGVALRSGMGSDAFYPTIISDGSGGAIVTWYDYRSPSYNIYAQRVNSLGVPQWTANGVALRSITSSNAYLPTIISDGSGGAIVTWYDVRSGANDIYAQRVNSAGAAQWTTNGVALRSIMGSDAQYPTITSSGQGGAIVTWQDKRSGTFDIYAQRVTTTYSITVTQAAHGTISPAGTGGVVTVNDGANKTFTITPDPDYHVADFRVDGSSVGPVTSYTFHNVRANHTVAATFASNSSTWYLAEGTTAWGFSTYISIENPNAASVKAKVTYMPTGAATKTETINLPALSQTTLTNEHLLSVMGGQKDFSTKVACTDATKPIAVDRTMTWTGTGASTPEAHCSVGVTAPSTTWYLPEGSSAWGFETWLLIQNPNSKAAAASVTYMIEGETPLTVSHLVPANSRASFNMASDIGAKDASVKVVSNIPVIPERAMYKNSRREGHDSIGTTTPAPDFYLAEGTTAWGFTTYVLIQNPSLSSAEVTVTYMTPSGAKPQTPITMGANSRKTIRVNDIPGMENTDFSTAVHGSKSIIAERAMYWDNGTGEACHDSIGMASPHTTFYLPDGEAGSNVETWTLVQNPNSSPVAVDITYLTPTGTGNITRPETIPANSRMTFGMQAHSHLKGRAAIEVTSKTPGKKIMVERAMYWNDKGAGTDTIGGFSD